MQELNNSLARVVTKDEEISCLRETAKRWAGFVLETNTNKALELGLKISKTICEYLNELEFKNKLSP